MRRRRVLVHAAGELGDCLAGPEIRALEFAKALGCGVRGDARRNALAEGERDGIPVDPLEPRAPAA